MDASGKQGSDRMATHGPAQALVAVLTPWNQECGLATYASFFLEHYPQGSYIVLAEDIIAAPCRADEDFVERCWRRGSSDFERIRSAIHKSGVKILHINCQYLFFPQPAFANFLEELRADGVRIALSLHTAFTAEEPLQRLVTSVDACFVHTAEVRLEVIANGAQPEKVHVIPHGVRALPEISDAQRQELRRELGMPCEEKIIVSFGFIQAHKNIEGLIEGIVRLKSERIPCRGYVVGNVNSQGCGWRGICAQA